MHPPDHRPGPIPAARSFVAERFPEARAAFVGGSVLTAHRTATSDLDVVVVLDGPPAPYRETFRHDGWVVEAFVHDAGSLVVYYAHDAERRVCSLLRMVGESEVVEDRDGDAAGLQAEARERIARGPDPVDEASRDALRYHLTDLLDDLAGGPPPGEMPYVAGLVLAQTTELALAHAGRWNGLGKWAHRELHAADPGLAQRLVEAHRAAVAEGEVDALGAVAAEVLDRAGGPLLEGYRLGGRTA